MALLLPISFQIHYPALLKLLFLLFALLTVGSALMILLTRNLLYAAFWLLLTFLGVAALYVLAGADFLAVTQVMIYVGGVLVLLIFGVMLTNRSTEVNARPGWIEAANRPPFWGIITATALFMLFMIIIWKANAGLLVPHQAAFPVKTASSIPIIGMQLMTEFALPFEVAAILLMVALVGAAYVAGRKE